MRKAIYGAIVVATGLPLAAGLAMASKPTVLPSATAMSSAPTRTFTGRPADLDPRIPWLEDLGMPQSGGPEPLVKVASCVQPLAGALMDLVAVNGGSIMQINGVQRVVLKSDCSGHVVWSHVLRDGVGWSVVSDGERVYCVPLTNPGNRGQGEPIIVFGMDGSPEGTVNWLIPQDEGAGHIVMKDGLILGDAIDGRRICVRIDARSTADADIVVTTDDVGFGGEIPRDVLKRAWGERKAVLGVRRIADKTQASKDRLEKRRKRVSKWKGRELDLNGLPLGESRGEAQRDWYRPGLMMSSILALNEDGSLWIEASLKNPFGYPAHVILNRGSSAVKGVPVVALFDGEGALRGYLLIRPPMGNPIVPAGDSLYVRSGERIERWEPIRR